MSLQYPQSEITPPGYSPAQVNPFPTDTVDLDGGWSPFAGQQFDYIPRALMGVPEGVALLNADGDVVDASGTPVGGGSGGVVDATSSVKGKLKLAGDLGGTADLPTVPALTGIAADIAQLEIDLGIDVAALAAHVAATTAHGVDHTSLATDAALAALLPLAGGTLTGPTITQPGTLTYSGATLTPIASGAGAKNVFRAVLTQASTIAAPSGTPVDGQTLRLELTQNGTGGYTAAFNAIYIGSDDLAIPQPATGANKRTVYNFEYDSGATKWLLLGKNSGFQL